MTEEKEINSQNIKSEDSAYLLAIETQINTLNDVVSKHQEASEIALENLKSLHLILSSIPKQMSNQLRGATPEIISAIKRELSEEIQKSHSSYLKKVETYDDYLTSAQEKLKLLNTCIFKAESKRVARFFLSIAISSVIAVGCSVYASSLMIKSFPTRVDINSPGIVHLNESEIKFQHVGATKVRRTNQKK